MIVTVAELKAHLRIEHDEEDDYLKKLITKVEAEAEDYCRVTFDPYYNEDGEEDDPPEAVRQAVLLMAGFYYENRDIPDMTTYKAVRLAFDHLLYPHRNAEKMF